MMAYSLVWTSWFFLQLFLFTLEVQCMDLRISDVRLRRIFHPRGGIVEVNFQIAKDTWKPVCAPPGSEGNNFADVVCSHLGFGGVSKMPERAPRNATHIYKRPISMSCTANGLLENCTSKLHFGNCEKLAYIECDYEPMKCTDRCGKPSNSYACGCDAYCVAVGDCCHDFTEICPQEHDVSVKRLTSTEKEAYEMYEICFQVFNEKNPRATITQPTKYRMVANCPSTWTNQKVVSECEANATFSNFLSIFPVHNEVGILFKNSYCALCHGTAVEDMLPWRLESDGSKRWVVPPRNIWGSQFNVCNAGFNFFKSCPPGTNKTISEKCDSYLKPEITYDGVIKNEHCGFCNGQFIAGINPIKQPVTFDVIFGLKSWSALTASCGSNSHIDDVSGLFQNACPLLNDLIQLENDESEITDTSPEQCVRDLMSKTFQISEMFYHLNLTMVTAESESYISAIGLPNQLTLLHLENSLRNRLTIPNCNLIMSVFLPSGYRCDGVDGLDFEEQPFDKKVMTFQCKQATCKVTTFYEDVCFENLTCRWEHEYLSPIDFKVEDFVAMEMTHVQTGAVLTREDFMITIDQQIHTCSEVLIGPWIRTAYFIQMVCGPLSLICIILMIMIHILFSKLRNIYGFCIVSLLAMLFISLVLFMLSTLSQMVDGLAQFVVAISHYAWLSAFAWMTVISFHVSHTFGSKFVANRMSRISNRKEVLLYSLFGWGIPLPFLLIGISLHLCDCTTFHYTTHWMSRGVPTVMLFALPAGVLALTTTILFINGIAKLRRRQATPQESETSRLSHMHNYIVALRLCFIVGIPWVLFIIYVANRNRYLLPILTLVNSLQGCFIFISFVTTRRVRALITEKLTGSQLATTTYSKGKHTAQTETGTPETTPRLKRGKLPGSSSPSDQHRAVD